VSDVARFVENAGPQHWAAVKHILRYLKGQPALALVFDGAGVSHADMCPTGWSDADWAGDVDQRSSQIAFVFMLAGGPISWATRKQKTVALSSFESEFMALSAAVQEAKWLRQAMKEFGYEFDTITINEDNQSVIKYGKNATDHKRSKHIDIRYHFVRKEVNRGRIKLEFVGSKEQIADMLTKSVTIVAFEYLRDKLGMAAVPPSVVKPVARA
jgi:hypothetical protein